MTNNKTGTEMMAEGTVGEAPTCFKRMFQILSLLVSASFCFTLITSFPGNNKVVVCFSCCRGCHPPRRLIHIRYLVCNAPQPCSGRRKSGWPDGRGSENIKIYATKGYLVSHGMYSLPGIGKTEQ